VSCIAISKPALDKTTPVKPPIVNNNKKPTIQAIEVFIFKIPPHIVANQLNILIPVGTAIIIVAAVKYALVSTSIPTVYI
jgi:hypothetical protein